MSEEGKTTITYVGADEYHGYDGTHERPLSLGHGESAEVSDAKAKQLAADRPDDFHFGEDGPDRRKELDALSRKELDAAAAAAGVDTAQLPNKAAVVAAIVAAE